MVKIAIAGGSSNVAQEIIEELVGAERHEIVLLSRKIPEAEEARLGVSRVKANYESIDELQAILQGTEVVLSFITVQSDPGSVSQKNLIDAAVRAGVKRFAPSEWATAHNDHLPWYSGKTEIREYLKEVNKNSKVLEYTLFLPGLFTNYLAHPHKSSKHFDSFATQWDFNNRRVLLLEGSDDECITLTTVKDTAKVVALAVEYEGEWPVIGGIQGTDVSMSQLISLGKKIRGGAWNIERVSAGEAMDGKLNTSWRPVAEHPAIPPDQAEELSAVFVSGMMKNISAGGLKVSGDWNRLFPEYKFTDANEFLADIWDGKP